MRRNAHSNYISKRSYLQRLLLAASTILIVCCVTGCGKKKIEYNSEENTTDEIEQIDVEIDDSLNSPNINIAETLGVEDVWEYGLDVDEKSIEINAAVSVPDTNSLKIVSAEEKQFDEAYKKEIVETLSDGEIYFFDNDHLTKKEIMEKIVSVEQEINGLQEDNFDQEAYDYMNAQLQELNQMYEIAPDSSVVATDYSVEAYKIEIDGIEYEIRFNEMVDSSYKEIFLAPIRPADFLNENYQGETIYSFRNNPSMSGSLSLEDIERQAEDFLNAMGIEGFKAVSNYNKNFMDDSGEFINIGCRLVLYRHIDGVVVDGSYYEAESIIFDINEKGIMQFSYINPLDIKRTVEDDVNILTYERAKSSMIQALPEDLALQDTPNEIEFNEFELLYYRCKESNESNEFLIVPVWMLMYSNDSEGMVRCIMINAIDGSYIERH